MRAFISERSLGRPGQFDIDLMHSLKGRRLCNELRCLYAVGCHRFEEKALIDEIFPALQHIVLFEPLPEPFDYLQALAAADSRVRIVQCAIGAHDGVADFHITNNEGESSSLLKLGKHREVFPSVTEAARITVKVRRLASIIDELSLPRPDLLIVDVQGAEYDVLENIGEEMIGDVRLIYTEVSTEPLYVGGRPLTDVENLLRSRFDHVGFMPLAPSALMHGNSVFVAREDRQLLLEASIFRRVVSWLKK